MTIINIADMIDPSNGKSYRENNLATMHDIEIGSLVELGDPEYSNENDGIRLFVVSHSRDCDGTPLYDLSYDPEAENEWQEFLKEKEAGVFEHDKIGQYLKLTCEWRLHGKISRHHGRSSLTVIR